jgi:hypothetical protein
MPGLPIELAEPGVVALSGVVWVHPGELHERIACEPFCFRLGTTGAPYNR